MLVFSGSSNKPLAKKLADRLNCRIGKVAISKFSNDEVRILVKEKQSINKAVVVQSLSEPTNYHLVEFLLIVDALKRLKVREVVGVIPWLGYSKQDQVFRKGEPLSVQVIARVLQTAKLKKIITLDLHSQKIKSFFKIPVINLSAMSLLADNISISKKNKERTIMVAPDKGAAKATKIIADKLGVRMAYIEKERNLATGRVAIKGIKGEIKGKRAVIVDDMIATGGTLVAAADFLKKMGADSIEVAVTHHLYVPGTQDRLDKSQIKRIIVTDTVKQKQKSNT